MSVEKAVKDLVLLSVFFSVIITAGVVLLIVQPYLCPEPPSISETELRKLKLGDTEAEVVHELGEPRTVEIVGLKRTLGWDTGNTSEIFVTFDKDHLTELHQVHW